jgi:hypothetical protein
MTMDNPSFSVLLCISSSISVSLLVYNFSRKNTLNRMLHTWATHHGYTLIRHEGRMFRISPFVLRRSTGQVVRFIEVVDGSGSRRTGWALCGSWGLGLWEHQVEVEWER